MSKPTVFIVAVAVALLSEPARPRTPAAAPQAPYKPVKRVAEPERQAIFADLFACRVEAAGKVAATAECTQRVLKRRGLQPDEIRHIELEGVCRQWKPLSGTPSC